MPAYNVSDYIKFAIESVLRQNYSNWELIIINDGSLDNTKQVVIELNMPQIVYLEQENKGVAAARNLGLASMRGEYFCFLDADDVLPPNSLMSRLQKFSENPSLDFVDGQVIRYDAQLINQVSIWTPSLKGAPLKDLVRLSGKPFFSPTWMIKRRADFIILFQEGLSHGEDLLFLMEISRFGGIYDYVDEPIMHYRNTPGSAMKNLKGLENGYRFIQERIKNWPEVTPADLRSYKVRWHKFMALDYLKRRNLVSLIGLLK